MAEVWFWQRIVTPHMAALAVALAQRGMKVTYVAEKAMSDDRARQGWQLPALPGVDLRLLNERLSVAQVVASASADTIHLCQGIRGNGLIGVAQRRMRRLGARQWIVMEMVDDRGMIGRIKRLDYRLLLSHWRRDWQGVLAIGTHTPSWVVARGMPAERVFPFAYFLEAPTAGSDSELSAANKSLEDDAKENLSSRLRLLFVGQLISRKRVDLLIEALRRLFDAGFSGFSLEIVGDGQLREGVRQQAAFLGDRVTWHGAVPMPQARRHMAQADCLVLPSDHDGWGAVVSEALMAGTPVICSDACGAAEVVRASGVGAVFPAGDAAALAECLKSVLEAGAQSPQARQELAAWARCLGAEAGADYLQRIFAYMEGHVPRPRPPWQTKERT